MLGQKGFTLALLLTVCVGAEFVQAQSASSFPVRVHSDSRYLIDADGIPFMIHGDSAWSLIVQVTREDAELYLEDRRQKGFNTILLNLIENEFADNAPKNIYGDAPFTTPGDFSAPNEAYFAHADWVLNKAAEKSLLVLACPAYVGHNDAQGWGAEVVNNGPIKCRDYGRYVGNRYQNFKNVVWVHWGDRTPAPGSTLEKNSLEVLLGIKGTVPAHLHTAHIKRTHTAREVAAFKPHMDLDAVYSAFRPYVGCLRRYRASDPKPAFLWEAYYEGNWDKGWPEGTPSSQRRQAYWTMTSGATGHMYGNHAIWGFGYRGYGTHPDNYTWKDDLNDPGTLDMAHVKSMFSGRPWHHLVPDDNHTVVTGGRGTKDTLDSPVDVFDNPPGGAAAAKVTVDRPKNNRTGNDYVTAARTGDGKLVMAYIPPTDISARTITVDMSKLTGPATAQWFNPNTGTYTTISGSPFANSGSKDFTTPGNNGDDSNGWVLLLEAPAPARAGDATPGTVLAVGSLETPWNPDFDVLEEPARNLIHFVGTESKRLRYLRSADGGRTWSAPEDLGMGWSPRMAVDSKGNLHLVYGSARTETDASGKVRHIFGVHLPGTPKDDQETASWYRARERGRWSEPTEFRPPPIPPDNLATDGARAPRIAVDGNDNVHVIYAIFPDLYRKHPGRYLYRCIYLRKPAGQPSFEPLLMLRHGRDATGGGYFGDLVVDRNGDVHIIYTSWNGKEDRTTHFVRHKNGEWGSRIDDWINMSADMTMKVAIGTDGVIHVAGINDKTLNWIYFNNRDNPSVMRPVHLIEDDWEFNCDILVTPDNDVWMSRENQYFADPKYPEKIPGKFRDKAGWYVHFAAATSKWGPRTRVAPLGTENCDHQHTQAPKFIDYNGSIRVFFAERTKPGNFKYYQKFLTSTSRVQVAAPAPASGPLKLHPTNPRYFTDASGKAIYLTGSHTWNSLQDMGPGDPPPAFDFDAYLDFLERHQHNFIRLWHWEQFAWERGGHDTNKPTVAPLAWARTGPGKALDGKTKFDLSKFDPAYFKRLRSRVEAAGKRGIYVSVMLFEGWAHWHIAWNSHPLHQANNVNGIDGDADGDGLGDETHTLQIPAVTRLQEAYVRKVIDTVGDLDNVLWEIANESGTYSIEWHYHLIRFIKEYEKKKPKQHPVGMTFIYSRGSMKQLYGSSPDRILPDKAKPSSMKLLFDSLADWISPNRDAAGGYDYRTNPAPADGRKVILSDTDHLWGIGGDVDWAWKSFCRGHNPIFMDPYDNRISSEGTPDQWNGVRRSMGQTRRLAERVDLAAMTPREELASTKYCLAQPGVAYIVYLPDGGKVTVDLAAVTGAVAAEWLHPVNGTLTSGGIIKGGANRTFNAPFNGGAVLCLWKK
ncbi:MAG: DUF4038 domain-containing protein [Verrucomicrobiales bacterium]|nr:DUF4038 domain-containing protein [Verrucomicrobiales bacterium]